MRLRACRLTVTVLLAAAAPAAHAGPTPEAAPAGLFARPAPLVERALPGLGGAVTISRDGYDVPTVTGSSEEDVLFALGFVHAEDRFFNLDVLRRVFSGTLGEILGEEALEDDVQLRLAGLRQAAERSLPALTPESRAWLAAYTRGVNAWLAQAAVLPAEYAALELTADSIPAWNEIDSLTIVKGFAFSLSFDLLDLELTDVLLAYEAAGAQLGFDGGALFSQDLWRSAPFDPSVVIPDRLAPQAAGSSRRAGGRLQDYLDERTVRLIRRYKEAVAGVPLLARALDPRAADRGSNWWIAGPTITDTRNAVLASDPHLDLPTPSIFYEVRLRVDAADPLDVSGVSFPGAPGVVLGCNPSGCWGATTNPMDVTDVYQEEVVIQLFPPGLFTRFEGRLEPIQIEPQRFRVNQVGDGIPDNLADAGVGVLEGGVKFIVPRRYQGAIVSVDVTNPFDITALSVQYTGSGPTRELDALRGFHRAQGPGDVRDALQFFDMGSQNWSWADRAGNIAYFSSAEMPVREDLQRLEAADGDVPPFLVRDGTHRLMHEWLAVENPQPEQILPYEILPYGEMPQSVNPQRGYLISANNDPVGTTLDNDVLNQFRPGGGIYYLNPGYSTGLRSGRLERLFQAALADDGKVTPAEVADFQANHQMLDAEILVPYVVAAFDHAQAPDAPPELQSLGADPAVADATARLAAWDFSSPTGIREGYDPGDDPEALPEPAAAEIDASVAATIYSLWRGQVVRRVIDETLTGLGLADHTPFDEQAMAALRNLLDSFDANQGVGASGVDFFVVAGVADAADERDIILLDSLKKGLDLAASDAFAPAFGRSTDPSDYRWGKLHRIVFEHPLGGDFNIPPAGGLADLQPPDLLGLARSGGFGVVDASGHGARSAGLNDFMFGSGPARRFVGHLRPGRPQLSQAIPGGESGHLGSDHQADQLRLWLTDRYQRMGIPGAPPEPAARLERLVPAGE